MGNWSFTRVFGSLLLALLSFCFLYVSFEWNLTRAGLEAGTNFIHPSPVGTIAVLTGVPNDKGPNVWTEGDRESTDQDGAQIHKGPNVKKDDDLGSTEKGGAPSDQPEGSLDWMDDDQGGTDDSGASSDKGPFMWTDDDLGSTDHGGKGAPLYTLRPVSAPGVHTILDLCLEDKNPDCAARVGRKTSPNKPCSKNFVAYNSPRAEVTTLPVRVGPQGVTKKKLNSWLQVEYRPYPIPRTHRVNNKVPTFFVAHNQDGNLFHFWNDSFIGLYGLMKAAGRLGAPEGNQVLYREDEWGHGDRNGHNVAQFEPFLFALSVQPKHDWYQNLPTNSCFSTALFGYYPPVVTTLNGLPYNPPEVGQNITVPPLTEEPYTYLKEKLLGRNYLDACAETQMTIIQRTRRTILNVDALVAAAREAGVPRVEVVDFARLSLRAQLAVAACTNILVGVQGAGLQWWFFSKPHRAMFEISWKHWGSFYVDRLRPRLGRNLHMNSVSLNWAAYEAMVRGGVPMSGADRKRFLKQHEGKLNHADNVWKWADVTVNVEEFRTALDVVRKKKFVPLPAKPAPQTERAAGGDNH